MSCARRGLLYSRILRQLVRKTPAYPTAKEIRLGESYGSIRLDSSVRASERTTDPHGPFLLRCDFRPFPVRFGIFSRAMDRPFLVRILTADLHCLKSIPAVSVPPCREALSPGFNNVLFFSSCLDERTRGRERAISTFPAIKELDRASTSGILSVSLPRDYLFDIYRCH